MGTSCSNTGSSRRQWVLTGAILLAAIAGLLALAGEAQATTYQVGPGKAYSRIIDVPLENLGPGDTIEVYYQSTPYRENFAIMTSGTASQPITLRGIPGTGGELPIIDGQNAVSRSNTQMYIFGQERSVFKLGGGYIYPGGNQILCDQTNAPQYVTIENLVFKNGNQNYTFTKGDGTTVNYLDNGASIRILYGYHITFRNCVFSGSGDGTSSSTYSGEILFEGCWWYDNGISGDLGRHNNYTQSVHITWQYCHFGPLTSGAPGNQLKDRSAGAIIRYNWIEEGNRQMDLIEADGDGGVVSGDSQYGKDFVYGNILYEPANVNSDQIIHYGWDMGYGDRPGPLHFFNNTIISYRTDRVALFRPQESETIECFNNILVNAGNAPEVYTDLYGTAPTITTSHNYFPTGIRYNFASNDGTNITGSAPGFVDMANQDFRLTSSSPCKDAGMAIPSDCSAHVPQYEYVKHLGYSSRPIDSSMDMGAYEYGTPGPLTITTTTLPGGTVGTGYSQTLAASGGTPPNTWSLYSGSLPAGLTLSSAGVISGAPTASGTSNFTVRVTDNVSATDTQALSIAVTVLPLEITTTALGGGVVGNPYSQTLAANGGVAPYTWSVYSGSLPAGLTLSSAGAITGTPTASGTASFTVRCQDSQGTPATDTQALSIAVLGAGNTYEFAASDTQSDTTSTGFTTKTTLTFTPTHTEDWLIIAAAEIRNSSTGASARAQFVVDSTVMGTVTWRPKDASDWTPFVSVKKVTLNASAHTATIDWCATGSTASIRNARIIAIRQGGLVWNAVENDSQADITTTETAYATLNFTPATSGKYLLVYGIEYKGDSAANNTINCKLGSTVLDTQSSTTRRPTDDFVSFASFSVVNCAASAQTATITAMKAGANVESIRRVRIYAVRLSDGRFAAEVDNTDDTQSTTTSTTFQQKLTKSWTPASAGNWLILASGRANLTSSTYLVNVQSQLDNATTSNTTARKPEVTSSWWNFSSVDVRNLTAASHYVDIDFRTTNGNGTAKVQYVHLIAIPLDQSGGAALDITTTGLPNGQLSVAYNQTLAATGGTTPYTWAVSSGSLPSGLSLSSGGVISGTPTAAGTSNVTVRVTDNAAATDTQALSILIPADLSVSTASLPAGQVNVAYSQTLAAAGGTTPYSWTVSGGTLPAGLSLAASTGVISGTPTSAGTSSFTVRATDAQTPADSATKALSIVVNPPALTITTSSLPNGQIGVAYSQTLSATGGTTPYTWSLQSGSLPAGLSLNASTGAITGSPTAAGTSNFTAKVTDNTAATAAKALSIVIPTDLAISTASLPGGTVGAVYSQTAAAAGGQSPYTWSVSAGSLPAGLSLAASTGVISGTPTTAQTANFTLQVTDSQSPADSATRALSIVISPAALTITTSSLPGGTVNTAYSQTVSATGGVTPYTWAVTSGSLPAGLSLASSTGVISGTPTAAQTASFTVRVTDNVSATATQALSITISPAAAYKYAESLSQSSTSTTSYINKLTANWSVSAADDYVLIATAEISSTYYNNNTYVQLTVDGTVVGENVLTPEDQSYPMSPQCWLPVFIVKKMSLSAASHAVNIDYHAGRSNETSYIKNVRVVGFPKDQLEMFYAETSATDVTLSTTYATQCTLNFTPATAGDYLVIYNSEGYNQGTGGLKVKAMNGAAQLAEMYEGTNTSSQGVGYYPFAYADVISFGASAQTLKIDAANVDGQGSGRIRRCRILAVRLTDGRLSTAVENASTGTSTNNTISYVEKLSTSWSTGAQSSWLLLATANANINSNAEGVDVRMQRNDSATFGNTVKDMYDYNDNATYYTANWVTAASMNVIEDASGTEDVDVDFKTSSASYTAQVRDVHFVALPLGSAVTALSVTTSSLPNGQVGTAYSQTLAATGGTSPYTWAVSSGTMPAGLSLASSTGVISGTPTTAATSNFTVQVTDSLSATATKALSITIAAAPALSITTSSLPNGQLGVAYSQTLTATGGVTPYTWSMQTGSLPAGLSLNASTGAITGTPTTAGTSSFTAKVTDNVSATATKALSILIPADLAVSTASLPGGTVGTAYSETLAATGGTTPYTWSVSAGSLPAGLSLAASTGVISGTPTTAATSSFTVQVTDSQSPADSATKALSITVSPAALNITTSSLPNGTVGVAYSQTMAATGGVTPYTWSVNAGSLPAGLSLASSTGAISGTPTSAATSNFTIRVTDNASTTDDQALSITIAGAPSYKYAESLSQSSTSTTSYINKLTANWSVSAADDYVLIATAEVSSTYYNNNTYVQLTVDGTVIGENVLTPEDQNYPMSPQCWLPVFIVKKMSLSAASHTVNIDYHAGRSNETSYIKNVRVVAFPKDQLEMFYAETSATDVTLSTTYATQCTLNFTPATAGDYLVIYNSEGYNQSKGALKVKAMNGAAQLAEMYEGTNTSSQGVGYYPFAYADVINFGASAQTLKIDAANVDNQGSGRIRRCRILAVRLTGGRLADAYENASTSESSTMSTSYVEKVSSSWSAGSHTAWVTLVTANANINSNTDGVDVQMQRNDSTTFTNQVKAMYDYNDNATYYNANWVTIAGMNVIENGSGTEDVDVDFKTSNAAKTAKLRDVHFVAVPLN